MSTKIDLAGLRKDLLGIHEESDVEVMDVDSIEATFDWREDGIEFDLETEHAREEAIRLSLYGFLAKPIEDTVGELPNGRYPVSGEVSVIVWTDEEMEELRKEGEDPEPGILIELSIRSAVTTRYISLYNVADDGKVSLDDDSMEVDW